MNTVSIRSRMIAFNAMFKALDDSYRNAAGRFDLPECALWILYSLRLASQPPTQKELCGMMHQSKQSINTALKKLISDGYIRLEADAANRRFKRIHLTDAGILLAKETADEIILAESNAFSQTSIEELDAFLAAFGKYSQLLIRKVDQCRISQVQLSNHSSSDQEG